MEADVDAADWFGISQHQWWRIVGNRFVFGNQFNLLDASHRKLIWHRQLVLPCEDFGQSPRALKRFYTKLG